MTMQTEQEPKVVQLTEEALLRLLNEARQGGIYLPPGAFRDEDGVVYRLVWVPTGRARDIKNADGKVIRRQEVLRQQKRMVMLVQDPSPTGLIETAKRCKRVANESGPDFYHPRLGWIRCGTKREVDVPENLGAGAQAYTMKYVDMDDEGSLGTSTATVQGFEAETETEAGAPEASGLASFEDAMAAGDAPREATPQGRRHKEN